MKTRLPKVIIVNTPIGKNDYWRTLYLERKAEMDEKKAREILGDLIQDNGGLWELYNYTDWRPGETDICLDGLFSAEDLEAIAWWMKNTKEKGEENGKETSTG